MRMRSVLLLAIAAGCGLVAMFLFQQVANRQTHAVEEQKVTVLVALTEVTPGSKLDEKNTVFTEFPVRNVPPNAITTKEDFAERCIKVRAFPGDVITADKLSRKGQQGLSNEIPPGMVALAIGVDNTMTNSGLLGPGDRVDVMVTYRSVNNRGLGKEIKTVLEYIEVFAVDEKREQSSGTDVKAKTITLIMTSEQGKLLKLAEDVGKLHLAMRSREDSKPRAKDSDKFLPEEAEAARAIAQLESNEVPESEKAQAKDALKAFLDAQAAMAANKNAAQPQENLPPPPPPKWSIEIYAGDQKRVEEVDYPEGELPPTSQPTSSNPLVNGLKSLFGAGAEPQPPVAPPAHAGAMAGPVLVTPPTSSTGGGGVTTNNSNNKRPAVAPSKRSAAIRK